MRQAEEREVWLRDSERCRSVRRTLSILKILEETKGSEWRMEDFADLFDVSRRTVFRDLLILQYVGYPLSIRGGWKAGIVSWNYEKEKHVKQQTTRIAR